MGTPHLRALVLGAAAGGGLPQWNCGCEICEGARDPDNPILPQTQSSLAVSANGSDWALLNTSPDIRQQLADNPVLHPRQRRDTPISSVLLTNGDIDHIAGLLILREKQPFTVYLTSEIAKVIADNSIFSALDRSLVTFVEIGLEAPFQLAPGVEATLFAVPGKVPLFLEGDEVITDLEGEQTVGVSLRSGGQEFFYVPGCAKLTDALKERFKGAGLIFFDGTVYDNEEMLKSAVGKKTGARMGHMAMNGENGSLQGFSDLNVTRKIYIHINNTNPVWHPESSERLAVERAGWEIGYDGMEVSL
ncbi:MAG: pyrroloquinoline quinone biosynthesis protein PqqB [Pseudomonadota bacterium]